jgi:REP-associated tyrosine transposase
LPGESSLASYRGIVARPSRDFVPGAIYHVFARGSNRQAIFTFDSDRADFLGCLNHVASCTRLSCLAYCLMSNHYHLVIETHDGRLSRAMQTLNGMYSNRFNRRYERDAHLFRNRFGAVWQEGHSQFLWTLRYVVMNPVEAGLCGSPEEWRWSSYRASIGIEATPRFLDLPRLLSYFGDTSEVARSRLRATIDGFVGV